MTAKSITIQVLIRSGETIIESANCIPGTRLDWDSSIGGIAVGNGEFLTHFHLESEVWRPKQ